MKKLDAPWSMGGEGVESALDSGRARELNGGAHNKKDSFQCKVDFESSW